MTDSRPPAGPTGESRAVEVDHSVVDDYLRELFECADVATDEIVEEIDDRDTFEAARERAARLKGAAVVVVPNDDGELLLVENDWMDGYGFPGGGVEPDEGWEEAARREVREETGVRVEIERPLAVYGSCRECGGDRYRDIYCVKYLARAIGEETVADDPGTEDESIEDAGWFGAVPDRAHDATALERAFEEFC